MSKDPKDIEQIDDYLSGGLDAEHRNEFEKKLAQDNDLQQDLNSTRQVIEGLEGHAFKKMLKDIHNKLYSKSSE